MKNYLSLLFIALFFLKLGLDHHRPEIEEKNVFQIPELINPEFTDSMSSQPFEANSVQLESTIFAGKFPFQGQISLPFEGIWSSRLKSSDLIFGKSNIKIGDSLENNGLEMYVDYPTTVAVQSQNYSLDKFHSHFPVFFVNSSASEKVFWGKDDHTFGIQEALDGSKLPNWKPIEGKGIEFCGNGNWGLIVHPGEFVVILMKKYTGDFDTQLRVRFKQGDNILVSSPFNGVISRNQVNIAEGSYFSRILKDTDGAAASWLFLGAEVRKESWIVKTN